MEMVPKMNPRVDSFESCFQKKKEMQKVCFDCTGAYGLHVSPRCGSPKAAQKYTKKHTDSRKVFVQRKNGNLPKNDTRKVSKRVRVYRANVPWAPLGAPLVPQAIFQH